MGSYNDEFKKKIVRLHLENGQSLKSLSDEYNVSKSGISNWVKQYREECQNNTAAKEEYRRTGRRFKKQSGRKSLYGV